MNKQRREAYLQNFEQLSPAEKHLHFGVAMRFLIDAVKARISDNTPALDMDTIDGECSIGDADE